MTQLYPLVALATCADDFYRDPDDLVVQQALSRLSVHVDLVCWNDPTYQWERPSLVVVRSVRDYDRQRGAFLHWARRVAGQTLLLNPLPLLEWNTQRWYLRGLAAQGIPVVPTHWVKPTTGTPPSLAHLLAERGWQETIIKPVIAIGPTDLRLVTRAQESLIQGQAHLDASLARGAAMMIQPFLPEGEQSVMAICGQITHAVHTPCQLSEEDDEVRNAVTVPLQRDYVAFARDVLSRLPPTLFARVDLLRDTTGRLRLSELHLVAPRLCFQCSSAACERLARALSRLARQPSLWRQESGLSGAEGELLERLSSVVSHVVVG
ncbi:hypothetical protein [Ktedonobacter racemifer]|uniref:ATP-grasp domain-containing protein n=1 Tax=Ktedonobacter racemifer DSM 44963 TaxID=485913 RepID=D6TWY9_KTERA|nr:hypothetical protein [Ktedonobacter racemifer]EFH84722.1 conserved hypothetical protein [Ktedonobacter racemifer DSM 44963]